MKAELDARCRQRSKTSEIWRISRRSIGRSLNVGRLMQGFRD